MKQISRATGLSYGLVYNYFPSKEEVFRHLVDLAMESTISVSNSALSVPGTAWEKLENLSRKLVKEAFTEESSRLFLITLQAMTQGRSLSGLLEHVEEHSPALQEKIMPVIIEAQRAGEVLAGDTIVLAATFFSFVQGLMALQAGSKSKTATGKRLSNLRRLCGYGHGKFIVSNQFGFDRFRFYQ